MKITFAEFTRLEQPVPVVIHSLEQALYQVTITIDDSTYLLAENNGKTFRCHSLQRAREALQTMPVASIVLRQLSAYDEMIGQPVRDQGNTLEIPLSLELYPPQVVH
ncbi:hypothetical protein F0M18_13525 [Pseudohalioglobus sediminis]|uniref:Uncharacterized protein n=1 Tax=Pseudohalioglobus sediminis TaxID=2606449 RepID=A0A5B0WSN4_9GAMM|nr:DUF6482 family protein [Pseudohalioglobus sediminis]KAA1190080.1 hypothetical protein F0M18_13525 [Pseudohalioglobus sediminis]